MVFRFYASARNSWMKIEAFSALKFENLEIPRIMGPKNRDLRCFFRFLASTWISRVSPSWSSNLVQNPADTAGGGMLSVGRRSTG